MKLSILLKLFPVFVRCFGRLGVGHLRYMAKQLRNENAHYHNGRVYVNTFFPPYPSKAFDKFLDAVIGRERVPYSTYFAVTDECPYRCAHCSYGMHKKGRVDTKRAIEVIEQIKSIGTVTIGFTGGEPLMRDDIVELTAAAGDDTASIIFTTGHRLSAGLAGELAGAGLDCMMIGVEASDAVEHDKVRGAAGSFDEAIRAIGLSLEAGIYTAISTVASKGKIAGGEIERLAELAEKYSVHEFRVLEPIATGSLSGHNDENLTREESVRLADFHKEWNRRNRGPSISSFSHLESDEMFGCGAGFHHLFIDAIGNVCPCDLTPLSFGNLLDEPLEEIWLRMGELFDLPRCGCLMKEVCSKMADLVDGQELPLSTEKSLKLCKTIARKGQLPKVYKNLLKGRKPANPSLNRQ